MPASASRASSGSASLSAKALSTSSMTCSRLPDPLAVRRQTRGRRVEVEAGAELAPQALAAARRSARSRRGSGTARTGRSTGGGCPARGRPRRRPSSGCPGRRAPRRSRPAATSARPARAGAVPLEQRGEHAVRAVHPGQQVGDRHADPLRVVRSGAGQRHQAGLALGDLVVAGPAALRSVVPEAGDRQHDQARVAARAARSTPKPEPVEHAGAEVLHQHVGPVDQPAQRRPCRPRPSGRARWTPCCGCRTGSRSTRRSSAGRRRTAAPSRGCRHRSRALDLDHPGAEVAQHHRRRAARRGPGRGRRRGRPRGVHSVPVTSPAPRGRPRRGAVRPRSRSPRRSGSACSRPAR